MIRDIRQQRTLGANLHLGITELAFLGTGNAASKLLCHSLHAVADAENRDTTVKQPFRRPRTAQLSYRLRTACKNNPLRIELIKLVIGDIERFDLTVNADLANTAGNQLGVLGTEIENQDAVVVDVLGHGVLGAE